MPTKKPTDLKLQALRQQGTLHPHPDAVADGLFQNNEFFDPRDGVQVKYEMLRRVQIEQAPVSHAAAAFGFSRPSFYQAQVAFAHQGLVGLLPAKRGPQRAHKLTAAVMEFIAEIRAADARIPFEEMARHIQERFGVTVHPRSIDRRLARQEKKRRSSQQMLPTHTSQRI